MYFQGKTIVITGATSGIGKALAFALAKEKATLLLGARRMELLEETAKACLDLGATAYIHQVDMAQPSSIETFAQWAAIQNGNIDILINNAGIGQRGLAKDTALDVDRQVMEVNFFGQVALTKMLLPHLIKSKGHIAVISSLSGLFGWYQRSAYAASKHALQGFFETLQLELPEVSTTIICPGRIRTEISVNAITGSGGKHGLMDVGQANGIPADVCAAKIVVAIKNKRKLIVIATSERILLWFHTYFRPLFFFLAKRVKANG